MILQVFYAGVNIKATMLNFNVYLSRRTNLFKPGLGDCGRLAVVRYGVRDIWGQSKNLGEVLTLNGEAGQVFTLTPNISKILVIKKGGSEEPPCITKIERD
jgi:hypothetical protein